MNSRRLSFNLLPIFLVTAALSLFIGCGDNSLAGIEDPAIQVSPTQITFDGVIMGFADTQSIIISNVGTGTLAIDSIYLEINTEDVYLEGGISGNISLTPNEDFPFQITYLPTEAVLVNGNLVIESNDREQPVLRIPIGTPGLACSIAVDPPVVDFGRVIESTENLIEISLSNRGTAPCIIDEISLIGSFDFSSPDLDSFSYPIELAVFGTTSEEVITNLNFEVNYTPPSPGTDEGALIIGYNSMDSTNFQIDLLGEGGLPDLTCSPNPIDFSYAPLGITSTKTVTCTNTGNLPIDITHIRLEPGSAEEFALSNLSTELAVPEGGILLEPNGSLPFLVDFTPLSESSYGGAVQVEHSNGFMSLILSGVGIDNRCPVAVARGYIRDDPDQRRSNEIDWATPTDILVLDGQGSFDPDGEIVNYEWELTQAPVGNTIDLRPYEGFEDDPSLGQFFIPLSGHYEFTLRVFDDVGFQNCDDPAILTVLSIPDETIHIELTWTNPLDFDESDDQGSDVDLHFVKVGHNWFDATYDAYYANNAPSWGPELPSLDIDDTDGSGPENVQMDNPLDCQWYAIGVHYFEKQFGTAYANIRVFIEAQQIAELVNVPLESTDDFWDVGRLHWPTGEFYEINDTYDNFDSNSAIPPGITSEMSEAVSGGVCD
jgi:hypothetical protein